MSENSFVSLDILSRYPVTDEDVILSKINDEIKNLASFELIKGVFLFKIDGQLVQSSFKDIDVNALVNVVSWIKNFIFNVSLELRNVL